MLTYTCLIGLSYVGLILLHVHVWHKQYGKYSLHLCEVAISSKYSWPWSWKMYAPWLGCWGNDENWVNIRLKKEKNQNHCRNSRNLHEKGDRICEYAVLGRFRWCGVKPFPGKTGAACMRFTLKLKFSRLKVFLVEWKTCPGSLETGETENIPLSTKLVDYLAEFGW